MTAENSDAAAPPAPAAPPAAPAPAARGGAEYKATVFLPETGFAMKAGLPRLEPELIKRWDAMGLYGQLRATAQGREKFVLHDGPPYANGHLHIGTALNKILKDVINRSQQMLGKDANYVPGWDCHGLPIEWEIEKQYRAAGRNKDEISPLQFREECRQFAAKWIDVQRSEFRRLGVEGDWAHPYQTMAFAAQAQIVRECHKFLMNGGLYRGAKPVLWSVVEKTALAEAEVEYHDHTSRTIWVRFPVSGVAAAGTGGAGTIQKPLIGASIVIWTTTPWTIPGNRAIAAAAAEPYACIAVESVAEGSQALVGERLLVARALLDQVAADTGIARYKILSETKGVDLKGMICRHPWFGRSPQYDFSVPVLLGDFVTMEAGTGFVHIAPNHGADDFELYTNPKSNPNGGGMPDTVAEDGTYCEGVALVAGKRVLRPDGREGDANAAVIALLQDVGALLHQGKVTHSYPHSWRSKAPLIFRATPQWFISMAVNDLRAKALQAIDETRFIPAQGRNRIRSMVESRPDWVVSRQRVWGVPLALFIDKRRGPGVPLKDPAVNARIADAFEKEGADAWFKPGAAERFLRPEHDPAHFEQVTDILDVWFDSGSTHAFVLEKRPDLMWPASLYLEGSDQHRGWFHSSLLESCGTRGRAPYDAVLTHGFVMDGEGRKMSKSLGNTVAPQTIIDQHGADILRLWVMSSDFTEDLRIGPEIIKAQAESYRKLRNTLRYLLGNLAGFSAEERIEHAALPELERFVLHRLAELDQLVRRCAEAFDFHGLFVALYNFCVNDLSAFYFDIRKDALYCDARASLRRRAARTVLDQVFSCLTAWLAPILCFTAEEAWLARWPDGAASPASVHLRAWPDLPPAWRDEALSARWERVRQVRRVVTGALEVERREKRIGSSLQAHPVIHVLDEAAAALDGLDLAEICITSGATLSLEAAPDGAFRLADVAGVAVVPGPAAGDKCQRCWQVLPEVGQAPHHPDLCRRCDDAVAGIAVAVS